MSTSESVSAAGSDERPIITAAQYGRVHDSVAALSEQAFDSVFKGIAAEKRMETLMRMNEHFQRPLPSTMTEAEAMTYIDFEAGAASVFESLGTEEGRKFAAQVRDNMEQVREGVRKLFQKLPEPSKPEITITKKEMAALSQQFIDANMKMMEVFNAKLDAETFNRNVAKQHELMKEVPPLSDPITRSAAEEYFRKSEALYDAVYEIIGSSGVPDVDKIIAVFRKNANTARDAVMKLFDIKRAQAATSLSRYQSKDVRMVMREFQKAVAVEAARARAEQTPITIPAETLRDAWRVIADGEWETMKTEILKKTVGENPVEFIEVENTLREEAHRSFEKFSDGPMDKAAATRLGHDLLELIRTTGEKALKDSASKKTIKTVLTYYQRYAERFVKTLHVAYSGAPTMTIEDLHEIITQRQIEDARYAKKAAEIRSGLRPKELRAYDDATDRMRVVGPDFSAVPILVAYENVSAYLSQRVAAARKILDSQKRVPKSATTFIKETLTRLHDGVREAVRGHLARSQEPLAPRSTLRGDGGSSRAEPDSGAVRLTRAECRDLTDPVNQKMIQSVKELLDMLSDAERLRIMEKIQSVRRVDLPPNEMTRETAIAFARTFEESNKPVIDAIKELGRPDLMAKVDELQQYLPEIARRLDAAFTEREQKAAAVAEKHRPAVIFTREELSELTRGAMQKMESDLMQFAGRLSNADRARFLEITKHAGKVASPAKITRAAFEEVMRGYEASSAAICEAIRVLGRPDGDQVIAAMGRYVSTCADIVGREFDLREGIARRVERRFAPEEQKATVDDLHADARRALAEAGGNPALMTLRPDFLALAWKSIECMEFPGERSFIGSAVKQEARSTVDVRRIFELDAELRAAISALAATIQDRPVTPDDAIGFIAEMHVEVASFRRRVAGTPSKALDLCIEVCERRIQLLSDSLRIAFSGNPTLAQADVVDAFERARKDTNLSTREMFQEIRNLMNDQQWDYYDEKIRGAATDWRNAAMPLFVDEAMMREFIGHAERPSREMLEDKNIPAECSRMHFENNQRLHALTMRNFEEALRTGPLRGVESKEQEPGMHGAEVSWLCRLLVAELLSTETIDDFAKIHELNGSPISNAKADQVLAISKEFLSHLQTTAEVLPERMTKQECEQFVLQVMRDVEHLDARYAAIGHWYAEGVRTRLHTAFNYFAAEIKRRSAPGAPNLPRNVDPDALSAVLTNGIQRVMDNVDIPAKSALVKDLMGMVRFHLPDGGFPVRDLRHCEHALLRRLQSVIVRYNMHMSPREAKTILMDSFAGIRHIVTTAMEHARLEVDPDSMFVSHTEIAELIQQAGRDIDIALERDTRHLYQEVLRKTVERLVPKKVERIEDLENLIYNVIARIEAIGVREESEEGGRRDPWSPAAGDTEGLYAAGREGFERALRDVCLKLVTQEEFDRLFPHGLWGALPFPPSGPTIDRAEFLGRMAQEMEKGCSEGELAGKGALNAFESTSLRECASRLTEGLRLFLDGLGADTLAGTHMHAVMGFLQESRVAVGSWIEQIAPGRVFELERHYQELVMGAFEKILEQRFPEVLAVWAHDENDSFARFDASDFSQGIPRNALSDILCEASRKADRELGMPVNEAFARHIANRVKFLPEFITTSSDIYTMAAWLFGKARATDSVMDARNRGGAPDMTPTCVHTREVNERHFEEAIRHVLAVSLANEPAISSLTLADIVAADKILPEGEDTSEYALDRDDMLREIVESLQRAARDCRKPRAKVRVPDEAALAFSHNVENVTAAGTYFARTHLPKKLVFGTPLIALHSFLGEAAYACVEGLVYFDMDQKLRDDIRGKLDAAMTSIVTRQMDELGRRRRAALSKVRDKAYPVPALLQENMPAFEPAPLPGNPVEFWDAQCNRMLTILSSSFADACRESGVYFASKEQQARTFASLRAYFDGMRGFLSVGVRDACARGGHSMPGVPTAEGLRNAFLQAAEDAASRLPHDLPPTIATLLEDKVHMALLAGLADYESPHEFVRAHDIHLRLNSWEASLGSQFSSEAGVREFAPSDVSEAADAMKLSATWAIVRKLLPANASGPIPASSFDVGWVRVIHEAVSAGVDGHVAREPRTGAYLQEVTDRLFGASRRIVLLTKLGSAAEHAVRTVSPEPPEALRGMRSGLALDPTTSFGSVAEIEARVLRSIGRDADVPYFDDETAVIDQFLANVLVLGEPVDEQLVGRADAVAALASELNSSFHAGHPCRTSHQLFTVLQERADRALDQLRARKTTEAPMMPWNSEESASLRLAVEENRAWIATWPSSGGEHGMLLQMIRRWHESSERTSRLSRNAAIPERDVRRALLDAETVRHVREKSIVSVSEPTNGDGRRKKTGLRVQSYKVQALLDWRDDQDVAIQEGFTPARTSDDAVSAARVLRELGREQASIEATLALSKGDMEDVQRRVEKLEADRVTLERMEAEYARTTGALSASEAGVPGFVATAASILAELSRWTALERETLELQRKQSEEHHAAAHRASQRLSDYTSRGGRDPASFADLSNELQIAEERRDLHAMYAEETNVAASIETLEALAAQLAEHSKAFHFDAETATRRYGDSVSLKKDARDCIDGFDEVTLLREERDGLTRSLAGMRSLVRDQELRLNGEAPLEGAKAALRRRHASIAEAIAAVRTALESALPNDHD